SPCTSRYSAAACPSPGSPANQSRPGRVAEPMTANRPHLALAAGVLTLVQALAFGASAGAAPTPEQPGSGVAPSTGTAPSPHSTQGVPTTAGPATMVVLSDERTVTTWAHPVEEVRIREHPVANSRTIART